MRRNFLAAALIEAAVVACATSTGAPVVRAPSASIVEEVRTIVSGGRKRTYRLFVPPSSSRERPSPLVIVLHGGRMTFDQVAQGTGFSEQADRSGFIVIYPKAEPAAYFNSGDTGLPSLDPSIDDVSFVRILIEQISAEFPVDPARVFAAGHSNGASMAHRLGCELSDLIAAIGPVAGEMMVDCHPNQPVSVIEFHGLQDPIFPFGGGRGRFGGSYPPVRESFARWRRLDGCPSQGGPCRARTDVVLNEVPGPDGHAWPSDATAKIWEFFASHAREQGSTFCGCVSDVRKAFVLRRTGSRRG